MYLAQKFKILTFLISNLKRIHSVLPSGNYYVNCDTGHSIHYPDLNRHDTVAAKLIQPIIRMALSEKRVKVN